MAKKPKEIKPGELFKLHNMICSYSINPDESVALKTHKPEKSDGAFVPPTLEAVKAYFEDNGYQGADAFYKHYSTGIPPWSDRDGKLVRSWKQKAQSVWFKEDRKIIVAPVSDKPADDQYKNMVF